MSGLVAQRGCVSAKASSSMSGSRVQGFRAVKRVNRRMVVQNVIPMLSGDATEQTPPDLPSYLFKERIVYLGMSLVPSGEPPRSVWGHRGGFLSGPPRSPHPRSPPPRATGSPVPGRYRGSSAMTPDHAEIRALNRADGPCRAGRGGLGGGGRRADPGAGPTPGPDRPPPPVRPAVTELMMAELLYLQYDNPEKPVYMYINSTGVTRGGPSLGYEAEAFAIYDCMKFIKPPVHTCAVGNAWGEAAMLLAAGERGHRAALPSASILVREPMNRFVREGGMQASDLDIYRMEMRRVTDEVVDLLSRHTNHTEEQIRKDISRARYFSPYEAKDYGIIDNVLLPEDDVLKIVVENKLKRGSYSGI